ncbi:hypothetical protein DMENIID0001_015970 [Sergentomyia squamirostris]
MGVHKLYPFYRETKCLLNEWGVHRDKTGSDISIVARKVAKKSHTRVNNEHPDTYACLRGLKEILSLIRTERTWSLEVNGFHKTLAVSLQPPRVPRFIPRSLEKASNKLPSNNNNDIKALPQLANISDETTTLRT